MSVAPAVSKGNLKMSLKPSRDNVGHIFQLLFGLLCAGGVGTLRLMTGSRWKVLPSSRYNGEMP